MYNIIDQLHLDHINVSKVLNLLDQQCQIMQTDEAPDYLLISDILNYFHNYPDRIHHPKENAVFEEFLKHHDEIQDTLHDLMAEHRDMVRMTRDLQDVVDSILDGAMVAKDSLVQQLADFMDRQKRHMDTEEGRVFPLLREKLTSADFQNIDNNLPPKEDPLFGEVVQKQYAALYHHIITL